MKKSVEYLFVIIVCFGCKGKNEIGGDLPAFKKPRPQEALLNQEKGYSINAFTGDSIKPVLLSNGDTLVSGQLLPFEGKPFKPGHFGEPERVPLKSQPTNKEAHPNKKRLHENVTVIPFDLDSLLGQPISNKRAISENKNKYPFDEKKNTEIIKHPQSVKSLPLRFKDNAINNMRYLDVEQGMISSYVVELLEDSRGNIWIGMDGGGVTCYDGVSFQNLTTSEGLPDNYVMSIMEDRHGNIWLGTFGGGVCKYDGNTLMYIDESDSLCNNHVTRVLEDKEGNIWISTIEGVSKFDGKSVQNFTIEDGLVFNYIWNMTQDSKGNIWFGTSMGVSVFNGASFVNINSKNGLSNDVVFTIEEDSKGNIWLGTWGGGVNKINGKTITQYNVNEGLSNSVVFSIAEDRFGDMWFGTYGGGVNRFDGNTITQFTEDEGLSNYDVRSILSDSKGNLWFGTWGGGVNYYDPGSFTFFTEKNGLSNDVVWSIIEDQDSNIWFATNGSGVNKYSGKKMLRISENEGLKLNSVMSAEEDKDGNLWFATYGAGVSKFDGESFTNYTHKEGLPFNDVRRVYEDSKGRIWFGTWGGGASYFDGEDFVHFTEKEGMSNNRIVPIYEDSKGNIWFGTDGSGVSCYDGQYIIHYTEKEGLSNNVVMSIYEDKSGNMWFATDGGGANCFDGEKFTYYTVKEGLSYNRVWSFVEDQEGNLWISTEKGLNRLVFSGDEKDPDVKIETFTKDEGLKSEDFFANSVCLDSKNRIWWGNGKMATMLDLNKFKVAQSSPVVQLNQIDINETFLDYRNLDDNTAKIISFNNVEPFENYPKELVIPYEQNHLTFHFSAIEWSAPNKIKYSYRMVGLNDEWSQPTAEPKADYRNLPYGEYYFQISAIGESGEWSMPYEYHFTVLPPWWHTWWARTLYVLIGLLIIILIFRWRTAKLKRRQAELETQVDHATKEIRSQKDEIQKQKEAVEQQKEVIEAAHKDITDSITYAKRIQNAILPPSKIVKEYLENSFILYKPKDIVAGDFYWVEPLAETVSNTVLFAAADCTGHGVPGAMVSVVCNNALNRSVREYGLTDPGKILDKTREIVIKEFEKSEEEVKDGMDIALCNLDLHGLQDLGGLRNAKLKFAGAHNPLWIIRKGVSEVEEIKADKQPIGKFEKASPFTTHEVELQTGDSFYIFSDGFIDQFGGEKGKKFKATNFRKLLVSIQDKSMSEQRLLIDAAFEEWRGELEQLDDVCVIGVRV